MTPTLPRAAQPFVTFGTLLRGHGFSVAPEQTIAFIQSIELLGPRDMHDVRRAAHATLAPPADQHALFDALFNAHFLGAVVPVLEPPISEDETIKVQEDDDAGFEPLTGDNINETGQASATTEALSVRELASPSDDDLLRHLARRLPSTLPRRRGYRRRASKHGTSFDLRRMLHSAVKHDGEIIELPVMRRTTRQRRLLLLIDVSGSMKMQSEANLTFAHTLARTADRIEVFTIGTRLTRITRALRLRHREQALAAASSTVSDWDGGTRLGDALSAFLAVPRFAGYTRGAMVVIISDGLERGDPSAMISAVQRIAQRAWRLAWLTPLYAEPGYTPETAALKAVLPVIDHLGDAGSLAGLIREFLPDRREVA
jgi:hypothetical protein